jgi:hypothetical protein
VNERDANAVAGLLDALVDVSTGCVLLRSLVVVKVQRSGESVVKARTLSGQEMQVLARYPELIQRPETFFDSLAFAVSELGTPGQLDQPAES